MDQSSSSVQTDNNNSRRMTPGFVAMHDDDGLANSVATLTSHRQSIFRSLPPFFKNVIKQMEENNGGTSDSSIVRSDIKDRVSKEDAHKHHISSLNHLLSPRIVNMIREAEYSNETDGNTIPSSPPPPSSFKSDGIIDEIHRKYRSIVKRERIASSIRTKSKSTSSCRHCGATFLVIEDTRTVLCKDCEKIAELQFHSANNRSISSTSKSSSSSLAISQLPTNSVSTPHANNQKSRRLQQQQQPQSTLDMFRRVSLAPTNKQTSTLNRTSLLNAPCPCPTCPPDESIVAPVNVEDILRLLAICPNDGHPCPSLSLCIEFGYVNPTVIINGVGVPVSLGPSPIRNWSTRWTGNNGLVIVPNAGETILTVGAQFGFLPTYPMKGATIVISNFDANSGLNGFYNYGSVVDTQVDPIPAPPVLSFLLVPFRISCDCPKLTNTDFIDIQNGPDVGIWSITTANGISEPSGRGFNNRGDCTPGCRNDNVALELSRTMYLSFVKTLLVTGCITAHECC